MGVGVEVDFSPAEEWRPETRRGGLSDSGWGMGGRRRRSSGETGERQRGQEE